MTVYSKEGEPCYARFLPFLVREPVHLLFNPAPASLVKGRGRQSGTYYSGLQAIWCDASQYN